VGFGDGRGCGFGFVLGVVSGFGFVLGVVSGPGEPGLIIGDFLGL